MDWVRSVTNKEFNPSLNPIMGGHRNDATLLGNLDRLTNTHGGWRTITRSSTLREVARYGYDQSVCEQDMKYLVRRDPTAKMAVLWPAQDTFGQLPRSKNEVYDAWLGELEMLGLPQALIRADAFRARDGVAFLYLVASAPTEQDPLDPEAPPRMNIGAPLRQGSRFFGFDVIPRSRLDDQEPMLTDASGMPTHYRVHLDPNKQDESILIHASRIIALSDDVFSESVMDQDPDVLSMYDDLGNLRDIIHALTRGIVQGNPIVATVDLDNEYELGDDEDTINDIETNLGKLVDGSVQSVAPVEGIVFKRLGPTDLDDANDIVRLLSSRISHATRVPVNMVLASSRGSEQVTDQDDVRWQGIVDARFRRIAYPFLLELDRRWKLAGLIPRRQRLTLRDLELPYLARLSEKEQMLIEKNQAFNLQVAKQSGVLPKGRWFRDKYEDITDVQDPRYVLPAPPRYVLQDIAEDADGYPGWEDDEPVGPGGQRAGNDD